MNILIIGEFSGFAKHLKRGFELLGHRVVIAHTGDGWKGFKPTGQDVLFGVKNLSIGGHQIGGSWRLNAPKENRRIISELDRLFPNGIELIICINYLFLSFTPFQNGVSISYIKKCISKGAKLIMTECGASMAGKYNRKEWFESQGYNTNKIEESRYTFLLNYSDAIIPTCYTYYDDLLAYNEVHKYTVGKVKKAIPLPITIEDNCLVNSCKGRKIVIFHGVNRPLEKGTPFIEEAMNRIAMEFPDRVDCFCRGGMPYDEYVKLFDKVDILIDQTYGNGWGMNAIMGAMKGKCVLAPCGSENSENMNIPDIPFVQIGPDSDQIYQRIKELVLQPAKIDLIKKESREFAVKHCECSQIAKRYLETVEL